MDSCIFCKIVKGELSAYKVWEDQKHLAFLSIFPIKEGHTLVIPKKHTDYLFDLEDSELSDLIIASKKVAKLLKKTFNPKSGKVGAIVLGLEVLHAHLHLSPMDHEGELTFTKAHPETEENLQKTLDKIYKRAGVI